MTIHPQTLADRLSADFGSIFYEKAVHMNPGVLACECVSAYLMRANVEIELDKGHESCKTIWAPLMDFWPLHGNVVDK